MGLSLCIGSFREDESLAGGVTCTEFLQMEHAGVVAEAESRGTPHMVLTLDSLAAPDVCGLIALWQWAAVYGGLLRGVNPFDQPAVEGSKQATLEMFESFGDETEDESRTVRSGCGVFVVGFEFQYPSFRCHFRPRREEMRNPENLSFVFSFLPAFPPAGEGMKCCNVFTLFGSGFRHPPE